MSSVSDSLKGFVRAFEGSPYAPCEEDLTPEELEEYKTISRADFTSPGPVRRRFYKMMAAGKERRRQEAIEEAAEAIQQGIEETMDERLQPLRKDLLSLLPPPPPPLAFPLCVLFISFVLLVTSIVYMEATRYRHTGTSTELVIFEGSC
jgi:hypothetical protein